ncbi:MAG: hypothetical protein KatS3mg045_0211 [Bellilinea sp.]|nr:MAG: hypothetical protein KatS3mg045_0211 [Bellilinea sp.]
MKILRRFLILVMAGVVVLAAAACAGGGDAESPAVSASPIVPTERPSPMPTQTESPTEIPTPLPAETTAPDLVLDPCIIGRWAVVDAAPYFQTAFEGTDITYVGTSGNAWYQFNPLGQLFFEAIQFTQTASIKAGSTDVLLDVIIDGPGFADYRIEEIGKIIFSNVQSSSITMEVEIFDERTLLDTAGLFGDPSAVETVFLYECQGDNRLLLTPPLNNYAVFPLILERYP